MSKISEKKFRKELSMIRRMAVQSVMIVWTVASAFIVFLYMATRFFPDDLLLLIVSLAGVLTIISGYLIRRIEVVIKHVWDTR